MNPSIFRLSLLFAFVALLSVSPVLGQYSTGVKSPRLYINKVEQRGEYFEIEYEVTAPGYVELHLSDNEDKKLWVTGKVTDRTGVDLHRIPVQPLKPGKRYGVILKYKGKDYSTFFYTNG